MTQLTPLYDIPLHISVEVGGQRLTVRDLMRLTPGSVVELRNPSGEPLDLCVNGCRLARCELVASDHASTIRIVEVLKTGGPEPGSKS